jgi:hypothetical protein
MFNVFPWLILSELTILIVGSVAVEIAAFQFEDVESLSRNCLMNSLIRNSVFTAITTLGLGGTSYVFVDMISLFDYENVNDNLETLNNNYSSYRLIPQAAFTILAVGI